MSQENRNIKILTMLIRHDLTLRNDDRRRRQASTKPIKILVDFTVSYETYELRPQKIRQDIKEALVEGADVYSKYGLKMEPSSIKIKSGRDTEFSKMQQLLCKNKEK